MLSINTNLSSLIAQGSMKSSTNKLNQAIERMTTGFKINQAKDNAANYSISTNMTTKMNSYMVAEDNVLKGFDMTNAASESLSLIEGKLKRLRSLATQVSNGTYGNQSLNAINSEAVALVDEINRIYSTAEYNGLKVFKPVAKIEIPDGVGTTGDVGVQTPTTYSMRATYSLRATDYGEFIDNPYTYEQSYVDGLTAVSEVVEADGFTESEYKIGDVDDLKELARLVNDSGCDTTGVTFILAADLDLAQYCADNAGGWTPIGNDANNFKGTFDGNGHTISNLTINRNARRQGLFGVITSAEIKNIGLEGGSIKAAYSIGGLVGMATGTLSTISNCYNTGSVSGSTEVGGIVGHSSSSNITNCYSTGAVSGTSSIVGGVAGWAGRPISNSYATGNITGVTDVGGLVGNASSSATISNCYSTGAVSGTSNNVGGLAGYTNGSVENSYSTGNITGSSNVGGLFGKGVDGSSISNSYATGSVTGSTNVGGLVGYIGTYYFINNSYAIGSVTGSNNVGGLVGYTHSNNNSINNSYATGNVSGDSFVGGLLGQVYKPSGTMNIKNCLSYSTVNGLDSESTGGLIGGAVITTNNTSFGTLNITDSQVMSQNMNSIGGSYMYDSTTYTLLADYDMGAMNAGVSLYTPEITSVTLQVGTDAQASSQITFDMAFMLENIDSLYQIGQDTTTDLVSIIDDLLATVSAKQTEYGAVSNRLESVLEEITIQRDNLVSSRSTIRDADIAEVSSNYIQQQILQQASATLLATANQSPSIALQLI